MAFRFENLEVWQRAADLSPALFSIADLQEERRRFRWAEQLRAAALSITNNIAAQLTWRNSILLDKMGFNPMRLYPNEFSPTNSSDLAAREAVQSS